MNYTPQFNAEDEEDLKEQQEEFQEYLDKMLEEDPDRETIPAADLNLVVFDVYLNSLDRYIFNDFWYVRGAKILCLI